MDGQSYLSYDTMLIDRLFQLIMNSMLYLFKTLYPHRNNVLTLEETLHLSIVMPLKISWKPLWKNVLMVSLEPGLVLMMQLG